MLAYDDGFIAVGADVKKGTVVFLFDDSRTWLTPEVARQIADALHKAADKLEETR